MSNNNESEPLLPIRWLVVIVVALSGLVFTCR